MKTEYAFQVRWGDTDAAGIVFYPNFYKWMDEASHEFLAALGCPSSILFEEQKVNVPLLETHCIFKRPLFFEDSVIITSEIEELHNKVFKLKHTFTRDNVIIAEGYGIRAWTSFASSPPKAIPIPEVVREKMLAKI